MVLDMEGLLLASERPDFYGMRWGLAQRPYGPDGWGIGTRYTCA